MAETSAQQGDDDTQQERTVGEEAADLLREVRRRRRRFSRVKNLLAKIENRKPSAGEYERWAEVHNQLQGYELGIEEVDQARGALVERLGAGLKRLAVKARMQFMMKLETLAEPKEITVEKISENPLVLYLEPLTVEVDFDQGGCRLLYGHEAIEELALDASAVVDAHQQTVRRLEKQALDSEEFFDLLRNAYRTVLVAEGAEPGDRVELVDVLVPLGMLLADRDALRKKGPEAIESFSRHLLAYQLAGLRKDGLLERDGVRLDLGAATGGSTRDKKNVLYIPVGANAGQYYRSIRFE